MFQRTALVALGLGLTLTAGDAFAQSQVAPPRPSAIDQQSAPQICGSRDPRRFPQDCARPHAEPAKPFDQREMTSPDAVPRPEHYEPAPSTPSLQMAPISVRSATSRPIRWMYVQAVRANCRAAPSTDAERLERLLRNEQVGVIDHDVGWSLLQRPTDCWVSDDLLGENRYVAAVARPAYDAPRPRVRSRSSTGSAYFANCSAARAAGAAPIRRGQPGYSGRLDRDGDGVACE